MRWLPLSVAQALGWLLGHLGYGCLAQQRALVEEHLETAFGPTLSRSTRDRIARGVFVNLGKNAFEWLVIERLPAKQLERLIDIQGIGYLQQAASHHRGIIAISGHYGNWELSPMRVATLGMKGGVLARRLRYPEYERFLWTMRSRKGVTTFDRGSLKAVSAILRADQIIGMMADQDTDSLDGVFVDFFGRPAYTPVGPAALSLLTGAPIVPCSTTRVGRRFRLVFDEPIVPTRSGDRMHDLHQLTQAWSRVVESHIRSHPDHWVWMHRRWKTQPDRGEQHGARSANKRAPATAEAQSSPA